MNNRNAWGFVSFGFVMGLLPLLAPAWFPPTGIDGTSARAVWLEVMGGVQLVLGGLRVLWHALVPAFIRWLAFTPPPLPAAGSVVPFELAAPTPRAEIAVEIEREAEAA
jgi:hypothetical protein